jgi:serine/threonine protein kinase
MAELKKIDKYTFNLKDLLGKGCYGRVYLGKNEKEDQLVAIKMIDKKSIQNDDYLMAGLFSEI